MTKGSDEKLREVSALRESEQRFRKVFEEGPLAMALVDKGFRLTHANKRLCDLLGYTEAELISRTFPEITHPDDIAGDVALAEQVFRGEIPYYTIEKRYLTKAGEIIWVNLTASIVRDEKGTPLHGLAMIEDITERKAADEELRRSEERFRLVLKAPVALFAQDRDLRFTWVHNPTPGFHPEALIGKTDEEVAPPGEAAAPMALKRQVLETGRPARDQIPVTIGGRTTWHDLHVEPHRDAAGAVIGVTCIAIDITERRHAEEEREQYRSMVTASSDLMVFVDATYTYRAVNRAYCEEHQRTQEEIIGHTVAEVFGKEAFETTLKPRMDRCLAGERVTFDFWWNSPRRGRRHVDARYDPFFEADGSVSGVLVDVRDTTERKQMEDALGSSVRALEAANEDLKAFGDSLAHDIKNPLTTVALFSAYLDEDLGDSLDEQQRDYLQRIRVAARHMRYIVEDLHDLSDVSRVEMVREKVDLSSLGHEIIDQLRAIAPDRDVRFEAGPGVRAVGDRRFLRILLTNLLQNAWKYCEPREGAVIELGVEQDGNGESVFYVRDNGIGFGPADSARIFKAFQRLHTEAEFAGSGLGLATAARIVGRHGGRIWAEGAPGRGATFRFTLQGAAMDGTAS